VREGALQQIWFGKPVAKSPFELLPAICCHCENDSNRRLTGAVTFTAAR
jgi:hypothetical protein